MKTLEERNEENINNDPIEEKPVTALMSAYQFTKYWTIKILYVLGYVFGITMDLETKYKYVGYLQVGVVIQFFYFLLFKGAHPYVLAISCGLYLLTLLTKSAIRRGMKGVD